MDRTENAGVPGEMKTIGEIMVQLTAKTGEKITVRRFIRYEVGEGLAKRQNDLAAEVAEITGSTSD